MKQNNQAATTKQTLVAEMKNRRGVNTLILFRNGDTFEAYQKDAHIIASTLEVSLSIEDGLETISFPSAEIETYSNKLLDAGLAVCISEMRDKSGNFIANIAQDEYEQDYTDSQ